jgi:hypothetical protein
MTGKCLLPTHLARMSPVRSNHGSRQCLRRRATIQNDALSAMLWLPLGERLVLGAGGPTVVIGATNARAVRSDHMATPLPC